MGNIGRKINLITIPLANELFLIEGTLVELFTQVQFLSWTGNAM